jgi:hypothetical protein
MLALNLRGDLAKLNDNELAQRLAAAWCEYEVAKKPAAWSSWPSLAWSHRGPVRHPRAYRFILGLGAGTGTWLDGLVAILAGTKTFGSFISKRSGAHAHLVLCEIRDIMDEVERRITQRQRAAA